MPHPTTTGLTLNHPAPRPAATPARGRAAQGALVLASLALVCFGAPAGAQVHKCVIDGVTTYQNVACPSGPRAPDPTPTANPKRRQEAAGPAPTAPTPKGQGSQSAPPQAPPMAAPAPQPTAPASRCDGRRHCSQMRSCEEAYYFLNHCPGVEMDGNHDGVPCEMQWCGGDRQEPAGRHRRR